eukprot:gb/GFBE01021619.1/.p1 GENE.gb/GFBE01021619.1/~~gb/GFBE01021619.1/.p1  ORF type:complete len:317 (+),score=67.39 gb/GFBE01021619.1/:1-951(+)
MAEPAGSTQQLPPAKRLRTSGAEGRSFKQTTLFASFARPVASPQTSQPSGQPSGAPSGAPPVAAIDLEEDDEARAKRLEEKQAEAAAASAALQDMWAPRLGQSWTAALEAELKRPSIEKIVRDVEALRAQPKTVVYPPSEAVFRAFPATPLDKVRVVIVGQDPYHGRGQAMGLSFSVPRGASVPPSLQNMLKEAGVWPSTHGDLTSWTQQGVLLLNSVLTVLEGQANSHKNLGWERFTDAAIRAVSRERKGVIFLLWGREAQAKAKLVDPSRHTVLIAGHPSPLSYERHFKGCNHFRRVNEILQERGEAVIDWRLQ